MSASANPVNPVNPVNTVHTVSVTFQPSTDPVEAHLDAIQLRAYIVNHDKSHYKEHQSFMETHSDSILEQWQKFSGMIPPGARLIAIWPKEGRIEYRTPDDVKHSLRVNTNEFQELRALYAAEKWDTDTWIQCGAHEKGCSSGPAAFTKSTPFLAELPTTAPPAVRDLQGKLRIQAGILQEEYSKLCEEEPVDPAAKRAKEQEIQQNQTARRLLIEKTTLDHFALQWALEQRNQFEYIRDSDTEQDKVARIEEIYNTLCDELLTRKNAGFFRQLPGMACTLTSAEQEYAKDLVLLGLNYGNDVDQIRMLYDLGTTTLRAEPKKDSVEDLLYPFFAAVDAEDEEATNSALGRISTHPLLSGLAGSLAPILRDYRAEHSSLTS